MQCPEQKKENIKRFKFPNDKKRTILGCNLLNLLLQKNGIAQYQIKYSSHGKPYLASDNSNAKFNISHSGDWVVCCYSDSEVGIDIEKIRKINCDRIAKRFFSKQEYEFLKNQCGESKTLKSFYTLWTLKESYIKALGVGLSIPLKSFSVIENGYIKEKIIDTHTKKPFYLKNTEFIHDYSLSICQENKKVIKHCNIISLKQLITNSILD